MKIDVSPDMPMYNLLESYPYDLAGALSEYIDNSLQAYLDAPEEIKKKMGILEVSIDIQLKDKHSQCIKITDNGVGISSEALQRAMKPGFKPEKQSLHEFGIGMKAASVWLGRKWCLSTYPVGNEKVYSLSFNLDELISKNQKEVDVSEITASSKDIHGVSITINKLRNISQEEVVSACTDLHDIYQIFIYREKILKINLTLDNTSADLMNQKVREEPKPLHYPKAYISKPSWSNETFAFKYGDERIWKEDISFTFNGLPVTGFIMVREEASQANNPGLALFRYKRLIQGSETKEYRPKVLLGSQNKAAPSKIYMELHLDGQAISHTKSKFNFDEQRLLQILKTNKTVKEFIEQAEAHRPSYENRNAVIKCATKEDLEKKLTELKTKSQKEKSPSSKPEASNAKQGSNNKIPPETTKKANGPIDSLRQINTPQAIIIEDITKEAIELYELDKNWAFALCFRVVLEKLIHEKIKAVHPKLYTDKLSDKGLDAFLKYLHSNQNLIDENHRKAVCRPLTILIKDIDITNLAAHGHSKPNRDKLDTLLLNTQELIKWSLSN